MVPPPNRRLVLQLLASAAGLLPPGLCAQDAPRDQGIGGTGARPGPAPAEPPGAPPGGPTLGGDRGVGGTGVIGTIRRFGSIIVNDLRITYPKEVAVQIDGEPATAAALKIGQVVHVVARPGEGGLSTQRIDVTSEVVGPVEFVSPGRLVVLGQRVVTDGIAGEWTQGARVAVSGLRRPDGVIVASLVESRDTGPDRVAGPVRREKGGLAIGGLQLQGADALVPGKRALVTGRAEAGTLHVTLAALNGTPFPPGLSHASIEAYIGRAGSGLALGSGLAVSGRPNTTVPRQGSVRAVVTARVAPDGGLTVERLRADGRLAPQPQEPQAPRLERERDRLDMRVLPEDGPGRFGPDGGGRLGGFEPRGHSIDTRPGAGDIPGLGGPGRTDGFGRPGGMPGGGPPGGMPSGGPPGGAPPGGFGGPGGGFGGPGGPGGPGPRR